MLASTEEETPGEESQAIALGGAIRRLACRYLLGLVPEAEYQRRFQALAAEYLHLRRAGGRRLRN